MTTKREREARKRRERLAGTRERITGAMREASREQHEREKAQVLGMAEGIVRGYRAEHPGPDPDVKFTERGERRVNNLVPAPPVKGRRRKPLPPMSPDVTR